jgi:hypothetical protein
MQASQGTTTGQRPVGVTILGLLNIIGGVAGILFGLLGTTVFGLGLGQAPGESGLVLSLSVLVLSIFWVIVGVSTLRLQPWAWLIGVLTSVAQLISNGYALIQHGMNWGVVFSLVVALLILWYLYRPEVRQAFGR